MFLLPEQQFLLLLLSCRATPETVNYSPIVGIFTGPTCQIALVKTTILHAKNCYTNIFLWNICLQLSSKLLRYTRQFIPGAYHQNYGIRQQSVISTTCRSRQCVTFIAVLANNVWASCAGATCMVTWSDVIKSSLISMGNTVLVRCWLWWGG